MENAVSAAQTAPELKRELREQLLKLADLVGEGKAAGLNERAELLEALLGRNVCRSLGIYPLPPGFLLSVVIPVYNEVRTVEEVVRRVRATGIETEVIVVDDGSTDGTRELLSRWPEEERLKVLFQEKNQGKGAALRRGFEHATGDVVLIQDADLEYDPADYMKLIQPIVEDQADVVYGSRFSGDCQRVLYFWHYVANRFLTTLSNLFTNLNLTDMETCFKVFRRDVLDQVAPQLREKRFGIEPEMTARVAKVKNVRIFERPISYTGRTYSQGKKIGWKDAVSALRCIVRYH